MHYSVFVLLLTAFLQSECGKVPQKPAIVETAETKAMMENEVASVPSPAKEEGEELKNDSSATFSVTVSGDSFSDMEKDSSAVPKPRPGVAFLTQFQTFLSQFLGFMGFRAHVERKHRGLELESENEIQMGSYRDGLKTTLGAVMGKGECYQKVTCRTGKYLKTIKGKELIIIILEKMTPSNWLETVKMLKDSAIHGDKCEYKCLD